MFKHLIFLSVPGLRPGDAHDPRLTPTLNGLVKGGASAHLTPTFPCVTSCVQANMLTGTLPSEHGIIANGFYKKDLQSVDFWTGTHQAIQRPSFFTRLARTRPDLTSAVWHAQNIKGADANWIVTPAPIHEPDGTTKPWCYSKPDTLYPQLVEAIHHFPLQHYWGPLASIESTKWILGGALLLTAMHAPNFHYIYIPHLDYAGQKYGPDSRESAVALADLDGALTEFMERFSELPQANETAWLIAGEYVMTPVRKPIYPNRILREAGLLKVRVQDGREYLDLEASDAFAMVDHQFAHVFVQKGDPQRVAEIFARMDDVPDVIVGRERGAMNIDHPLSAPVILVSRPDQWFAYYWWLDDAAAPPFARTVDIHAKPGYDPVELFFDPATRSIPLDATLIKGSHGAPAVSPNQQSLLIASHAALLDGLPASPKDTDVFGVLCRAFGI